MELEVTLNNDPEATVLPVSVPDLKQAQALEDPFAVPYQSVLCFDYAFRQIEVMAKDNGAGIRVLADELFRRVEAAPELRAPITDYSLIEKHKDTLELLWMFLVPPSRHDSELFKFGIPFGFMPLYVSPAMKKLMDQENACYSFGSKMQEIKAQNLLMAGCTILHRFYGVEVNVKPSAMLSVPDPVTGLKRFYKPTMDESFIEVIAKGDIPKLDQKQIHLLLNNISNTDLWLEMLPPEKFEFHGFHVANLTEVTEEEALGRLKHRLISRDAILDVERVRSLADLVRIHFQKADLQLGLSAVDFPSDRAVDHEYRIRFNLLSEHIGKLTDDRYTDSIYHRAFQSREVVMVEDLKAVSNPTKLEKLLLKLGIRSILVAPLLDQAKNVIGVAELASPEPFGVNAFMEAKFGEIRGLFRTAVERSREYIDNRIEAILRDQYTRLHPSIEWRFTEAAFNILQRQEEGLPMMPETISFQEVYPIYGQADIVGSSRLRNTAIYQDLFDNLRAGRFFLVRAMDLVSFPLIGQVIMQIDNALATSVDDFDNSHEISISQFIIHQLTPIVTQLGEHHADLRQLAKNYRDKLDPELGLFYRVRRDYEESLQRLNRRLSDFFTERDNLSQASLPHYFEKYRTDGVEYEIYAGQSLLKNQTFSDIHLRNLRLSQLIDMCDATRLVKEVSETLPMPLRTAQLIFAYTTPLDIRFRMDEKRFDVDGDYNVRYEILKKRIDKATINGGTERLTQAGMISIVYLQEAALEEYNDHLHYLHQAGYVEGEIEELVLDPLQSVNGLRALRFRVKTD
ncbi:GAF domain-containing protein [Lewinella sp. W8]|uniref:GAF domain-containing protein n=1 Tax=Lewinella sp. W8 TaxID=2528208 RepID=UPI001067FDFD|nr:GAF domain-containing protein [Lewinella sp. W8]MTB49489.1 hypothetical protein [Lewinella sp. W8]